MDVLNDEDCNACAAFREEAQANRADLGDLLRRVQMHELDAHRDQHQPSVARR